MLPSACCDPTLAWDVFGNLFLGYLDSNTNTRIAISTDAGQTFSLLATFGTNGTDQPTITVGPGTGGIGQTLWVTYTDGGILIAGAPVTGRRAHLRWPRP